MWLSLVKWSGVTRGTGNPTQVRNWSFFTNTECWVYQAMLTFWKHFRTGVFCTLVSFCTLPRSYSLWLSRSWLTATKACSQLSDKLLIISVLLPRLWTSRFTCREEKTDYPKRNRPRMLLQGWILLCVAEIALIREGTCPKEVWKALLFH